MDAEVNDSIGSVLEQWAVELRRAFRPSTVKLKLESARRCIGFIGDKGAETTTDDLRAMADSMGDISAVSKDRCIRYYGEFLAFAYGVNPYLELRSSANVGSRNNLKASMESDDKLARWFEWMIASGRDRNGALAFRNCARNALVFLQESEPGLLPEQITASHLLRIEREGPWTAQGNNRNANMLSHFAEWCGSGPVQQEYHDLRSEGNWQDRVFSGKFGEQLRGYYEFMRSHYFRDSSCKSQVNSALYASQIIESVIGEYELEDIGIDDLLAVRHMQDRVSENTLRTYLTVFGQFLQFATGKNPYVDRQMQWNGQTNIKRIFLSTEEWETIVTEADETERIVVVLGSLLGLRKSEIVGLRLDDIDSKFIHIRGKGHGPNGKESDSVLDQVTKEFIDEYMMYRDKVIRHYGDYSEGRLIVVPDGVRAGHPYTVEGLSSDVRRFSDRLGIRFSCHCFRRYYATCLYDNTQDLNLVRKLMRHSRVETTVKNYIEVNTQKMAQAQSALSTRMRGVINRTKDADSGNVVTASTVSYQYGTCGGYGRRSRVYS